jgi:hypothetical protein
MEGKSMRVRVFWPTERSINGYEVYGRLVAHHRYPLKDPYVSGAPILEFAVEKLDDSVQRVLELISAIVAYDVEPTALYQMESGGEFVSALRVAIVQACYIKAPGQKSPPAPAVSA